MPAFYFRSIHTLEVTAAHAVAARFTPRSGGLRPGAIWRESVEAPGDLAGALTRLRLRVGKSGPVTLILPARLTLTKFIRIPRLGASKRAKVIAFAAQEAIPHPLAEVAWDSYTVDGDAGDDCDLLLGAAKLEKLQPLLDAVHAAGFAVRDCLPAQVALHAAVRGAGERGAPPVLVIDLAVAGVALALLDGRKFRLRSFCLGDDGGATRGALAWDEGATRLAREITRTCLHFEREGRAPPRRILLTGHPEVAHAVFAELLSARTGLPVRLFDPLATVESSPSCGAADRENRPHPATHVGAAWMRLHRELPVLNLLPPAVRTERVARRRRGWLTMAAALLAAALLPPVLHFRTMEAELRRQAAAVEAEIAALRACESEIKSGRERLASLQRQIAVLQSVHAQRGNWRSFLADLQQRVAESEDVWLERLHFESGEPPRLHIAGRVLDRMSPDSAGLSAGFSQVSSLLDRLARSPHVETVERERFDARQPGLLHFDFVVVGKVARSL